MSLRKLTNLAAPASAQEKTKKNFLIYKEITRASAAAAAVCLEKKEKKKGKEKGKEKERREKEERRKENYIYIRKDSHPLTGTSCTVSASGCPYTCVVYVRICPFIKKV